MIVRRLLEKPSRKILKINIIIGFVLCFDVIPLMQYYTQISGFPAPIFSSQLSFSGDLMKSYYAATDINNYRIAASLDYIFMVGYGLILFSTAVLIGRKFGASSIIGVLSFFVAISGVVSACCDGVENIFILAMLTNPTNFPDQWAIAHSVFALIKWILLFIALLWIIIIGIFAIFRKKKVPV